ncbi:MAG: site-specific integrase [Phycisphaerae bacterium]|nr:site-specific integrase [Phycisphaerae bacterium]
MVAEKADLGAANLTVDLGALVEAAAAYASDARSPRTHAAYSWQWRRFTRWCSLHGLVPIPATPETVALYVTHGAETGLRPASIALALSAITAAHRTAREPSPCTDPLVARVREGVVRRLGSAPKQKDPLDVDDLKAMVRATPPGLIGDRDRALVLVGFASACRRSELAALDVTDVAFVASGIELTIRKSKTDQRGAGSLKVIAMGRHESTCPVRSLRRWLASSGIIEGPVFRPVDRHGRIASTHLTGHAVATIIKRSATRAGLDAARFSGHSLRAGFVTTSKLRGASDAAVMDQTGHKSLEILRRYTRRIHAWDGAASAQLGL